MTIGLVSATLLVFGDGCANSVNTIENAQKVGQPRPLADKRIISNPGLGVEVIALNSAISPNGFLKIQFDVKNTTFRQRRFTYRIDWYDEQGMVITLPTTAAIPVSLEGRETRSLTQTAPTPAARDFRITFMASIN